MTRANLYLTIPVTIARGDLDDGGEALAKRLSDVIEGGLENDLSGISNRIADGEWGASLAVPLTAPMEAARRGALRSIAAGRYDDAALALDIVANELEALREHLSSERRRANGIAGFMAEFPEGGT